MKEYLLVFSICNCYLPTISEGILACIDGIYRNLGISHRHDMVDAMRLIGLLLFVLTCSTCAPQLDLSAGASQNFQKELGKQRYQVHVVDPPIVFAGATAMIGGDGNWPFIGLLKNNTIHIDLNAHHTINGGDMLPIKGLGPTFKFKELAVSNDFPLIEKASVLVHVQGDQLIEDRYYGISTQARDSVEIDKESINCNLAISSGLRCRVNSSLKVEPGPFKTVWHSFDSYCRNDSPLIQRLICGEQIRPINLYR